MSALEQNWKKRKKMRGYAPDAGSSFIKEKEGLGISLGAAVTRRVSIRRIYRKGQSYAGKHLL